MIEISVAGGIEESRILLSAALKTRRDIRITNLPDDPSYEDYSAGVIGSFASAAQKFFGASIEFSRAALIMSHTENPPSAKSFGKGDISIPAGIPLSEMILFLAPALSHARFRSVLGLEGTTHAGRSLPITFVRDTLFDAMARFGFYAGINLNRFGFLQGGGSAECRIYPAIPVEFDAWQRFDFRRVSRGRIYAASLNQKTAPMQKKYLSSLTGLDEKNISVIEIMNAPGIHNSVYIYVETERFDVIFFIEIDSFMSGPDPSAAEQSLEAIALLAADARGFHSSGIIPPNLERELLPYAMMSGSNYEPQNPDNIPLARSLEKILFP